MLTANLSSANFLTSVKGLVPVSACPLFGTVQLYQANAAGFLATTYMNMPGIQPSSDVSQFQSSLQQIFSGSFRRLLSQARAQACIATFCDSLGTPCLSSSIPCFGSLNSPSPTISAAAAGGGSAAGASGGSSSTLAIIIVIIVILLICLVLVVCYLMRRKKSEKVERKKVVPVVVDVPVAASSEFAIAGTTHGELSVAEQDTLVLLLEKELEGRLSPENAAQLDKLLARVGDVEVVSSGNARVDVLIKARGMYYIGRISVWCIKY